MKKIKKFFKSLLMKIKKFFKQLKAYDYIRTVLYIGLGVLVYFYNWIAIILALILLISLIVVSFSNMRLRSRSRGNGIIYGGRGKGKGLLLNHIILKDKTKPFVNVPYGYCLDRQKNIVINSSNGSFVPYVKGMHYDTELLSDINDYFGSISPLDIESFINGGFDFVAKNEKFEGRNVYFDDVNVYTPNFADSLLKKNYPSMPPMLAINRHLYNAYMVITTQDRERPYKILKELQSDFSIKAVKTLGFGFIWKCIPLLSRFVYTKYIYHELPKSADMLPFSASGLINEALKPAVLTAGQATKEVYEATHGKIAYGFVLQLKNKLNYNTRYFHKVVFGKYFNEPIKVKRLEKPIKIKSLEQHEKEITKEINSSYGKIDTKHFKD